MARKELAGGFVFTGAVSPVESVLTDDRFRESEPVALSEAARQGLRAILAESREDPPKPTQELRDALRRPDGDGLIALADPAGAREQET